MMPTASQSLPDGVPARERAAAAGLRPGALLLALFYTGLTVAHPLAAPPPAARPLTGMAGVTAAVLWTLWVLQRRRPIHPDEAFHVLGLLGLLTAANTTVHLALTGHPEDSTNVMLVLVGVTALVQHTGWAAGTVTGMLAVWGWVARTFATEELVHFGVGMVAALVLGLVLRRVMAAAVDSLEAAWRHAADLAIQDELTGLLNRRGLAEIGPRAMAAARRLGLSLTAVYLDIDDLKTVNDREGHHAGDALLRDAADRLQTTFRDADVVARVGGDEFVVLLVGGRPGEVDQIAPRIRRAGISASVGAAVADDGESLEVLLGRADQAMYADKSARRPCRVS